MDMRARFRQAMCLALATAVGCAASTSRQVPGGPPSAGQGVLRVGVSPDAPPIAFDRDGRVVRVEPDLAQGLVDHFRRPVELVPLEWDSLIPALLDGRIDAIMSGMTVTPARQVRVAFADPWMQSGLAAAVRRGDVAKYGSLAAIRDAGANVGVRAGSTADRWVREHMPYATAVPYPDLDKAARELAQGRLDLVVSDIPQVAWAVSAREGDLQLVRVRLTREDIAWAFRPQDTRLRAAANAGLAAMQQDGRLRAILQRWMPYVDDLDRWR